MFPNPVSDFLHIETKRKIKKLIINDVSGRIIKQEKNLSAKTVLNLIDLAQGLYIISLYFNDGQIISRKIVKSYRK